jgi:hypothetical protein
MILWRLNNPYRKENHVPIGRLPLKKKRFYAILCRSCHWVGEFADRVQLPGETQLG